MSTPDSPTVDVVSDVVCPWCYVGKRHLDAALAQLEREGVTRPTVRWHPYELDPGVPRDGIDRREYLERKFGGGSRLAQVHERLHSAGTQAGIAFDFGRIARQPNTRDAHRLIAWAQHRGDAGPLVEKLFRAFFVEGRFVGSHEVLADLAAEAGEDRAAAVAFLLSPVGDAEIEAAESRAASLGIRGVPFFIIDGRFGLSGAQPPEAIADAMRRARQPQAAD
ncbi:MAG: DsbA family oxidoreductase [Burkholderiales bacterium]|nr:DsbA family oxidoreductase [Burkholderiales bacterium]MCE7879001.1 DsbA family oxidoreductase [Betaproteobacteria bacterium PRO3]